MWRRITLIAVILLMCCSVALARRIAWKANEKPPVSLAVAAALADAKAAEKDEELFCIGASLAKTFSGGDWEFQYSSAKGKQFWISVASDKSIRVSDHGFEY